MYSHLLKNSTTVGKMTEKQSHIVSLWTQQFAKFKVVDA